MQRALLRRIVAALAIILSGLTITLVAPQVASAHSPVINAAPSRPCGADAPWSVSGQALQGADYGDMEWRSALRIRYGSDPAGDWPGWSAWTLDSAPVSFSFSDIPASVESVEIQLQAQWRDIGVEWEPQDIVNASTTVARPDATECPPPPCEYNPEIPSDDPGCFPPCEYNPEIPSDDPGCFPPCEYNPEIPSDDPGCFPPCEYNPEIPSDDPGCFPPCEYNPEIPADDPGCTPPTCEGDPQNDPECQPDVRALCREYSLSSTGADSTVGYWYDVTNPQAGPVTITYYDSVGPLSITLAGGQTTRIRVDSTDPRFLVEGSEIATPVPGEDCELELIVTKELNGPPPGEALYTVDIAYYDDGVETLILTFELSSEEPEAITLPASYGDPGDDGAIEYIVREVGENQGTIVSYSPSDRFFGSGNVGEQVSVVITNSYAAVEIDKTVNDDRVEPGQTIFYELIVSNTGGLALENLAIDDLFPATILFVDYEVVGEGLPISCTEVPTPDGPDYLTCDATGVLEPGQTLPTIRVTAEVGPGASSVDHFDNQSRVIGDFIVSDDSPSGPAGFSRGAFGQSRGVSVEVSPVRVLAAPPPPGENLSCAPVEGQVCNVSPVVLAVGQVPGSTTTTTVVGGGGELPETGSDVTDELVLLAMGLLVAGSAALVVSRRRITS